MENDPHHYSHCPDCDHIIDAHNEDGICTECQDEMDRTMPGGAQGAHVEPCPSLDPEAAP